MKKQIRSGLKAHIFLSEEEKKRGYIDIKGLEAKIKIKGWILASEFLEIQTENGRCYIDILPRFEQTSSGFTHIVFEKTKPPDDGTIAK